jgi:lipid-binding SYLF domain-containing protein
MNRSCRPYPSAFVTIGKKALLMSVVVSAIGSASPAQHAESTTSFTLRRAASVLEEISAISRNGVPDAVLNSTKCVVVIPSAKGEAPSVSARGVVTCRDTRDGWSAPAYVKFSGRGVRGRSPDFLVFVLSDKGVGGLRSGTLQIGGENHAPAPLVNSNPITTQVELTAELFTYERARGVLSSSEATGVILGGADNSNVDDNQVSKKNTDKYLSSVVSFFNTITATGIVFHHTALIPGENKPPRSERDVDKYHQERGFEILCFGRVYHLAYHYLIMPNGRVIAGRPERCEGAHAVGYNSYLGISLVGDFSSEDNPTGKKGPTKPSAAQIASLLQLCRRLRQRYNIPLQHIVRHSDISNTKCPGDRFPFRMIMDQLQSGPNG